MVIDPSVTAGTAALELGRWDDAVAAFEASLAERETPEALEGMGRALWWLCDARASVRYRERAYVGFMQAGDTVRACTAAIDLSISYLVNLGNEAAARGWLARAQRVMAQADPNPMQGWLWDVQAFLAGDADRSRDLLEQAIGFARRARDSDLELVALADLGLTLVVAGRVDEGLAMLDEAMAGTLGGECRRLETVVFTSCNMMSACSLAGDVRRATQWCNVADEFMGTYGSPFLFAHCRACYGGVLVSKGRWDRAEEELRAALRTPNEAGPEAHAQAMARLAELRCRQGRVEEADALLAGVDDAGAATVPAAFVRLARGEPAVAVALLERRLGRLHEAHAERPAVLAVLVDAHLAAGDLAAATRTAVRLDSFAREQGRPQACALAALACGRVSRVRGDAERARAHLERALEGFAGLDLPHETARVRLELAGTLAGTEPEVAVLEARSALVVFERLGAATDGDAAAAFLRSLGAPGRTGPRQPGVLTRREEEVLRLVGLGLSNPEIAERLFISRKTAAHHVSNLLAKLGLRNRAEAVAYAARTLDDPGRDPGRPPARGGGRGARPTLSH